MRFILVLLFAVFSSVAHAGKNDATWNPPARYDHPYTGALVVTWLPQKLVAKRCMARAGKTRPPGFSDKMRGCAFPYNTGDSSKDFCIVFVSNHKVGKSMPKAIYRHEIGHCNGWPPSHPDD